MTRNLLSGALLLLALTAPTAATAGLVTWELQGSIEQVGPYSFPGAFQQPYANDLIPQLEDVGLVPGTIWRARVSFDSEVPPEPCDECLGSSEFIGATKSIDFLAGSFSASAPYGSAGDAFTQANASYTDFLAFQAPMVGGAVELVAESAGLYLLSLQPNVFVSSSLPDEPPEFAALAGPSVGMYGLIFGTRFSLLGRGLVRNTDTAIFLYGGPLLVPQSFMVDGRITSITPVPEPSLVVLLLALAPLLALRLARTRAPPVLMALAIAWPGAASAGPISLERGGTIRQVAPYEIEIPNLGTQPHPNAVKAIEVSSGAVWPGPLISDSDLAAGPCRGCADDAESPDAAKPIEFSVGAFAAVTPDGVVLRSPVDAASGRAAGDSSTSLPNAPPYRGLALVLFALVALGSVLALSRS